MSRVKGLFFIMNSTVFWDVTQCNLVEVFGYFGITYFRHLQGRRVSQATGKKNAASSGITFRESRTTLIAIDSCWLLA
jgi:hypothetical protein